MSSKKANVFCLLMGLFFGAQCISQELSIEKMPRLSRAISPDATIVQLRKTRVEIIKDRSVELSVTSSGATAYRVAPRSSATAILSETSPVLVFNHDYGSYGYITGEIVFKFKSRELALGFPHTEFSKFRKLGNLDVYVIQASSPDEFVSFVEKLTSRRDIAWIEPTINYVSNIKFENIRK